MKGQEGYRYDLTEEQNTIWLCQSCFEEDHYCVCHEPRPSECWRYGPPECQINEVEEELR